jgi:hypothetical protein
LKKRAEKKAKAGPPDENQECRPAVPAGNAAEWQDLAEQLAHEIKNSPTPVKLSTSPRGIVSPADRKRIARNTVPTGQNEKPYLRAPAGS